MHYYGAPAAPGHPYSDDAIDRAAVRHADHLLEHFIIRNAGSERLSGKLVSRRTEASADEPSRDGRPRAPRIVYCLQYALKVPPRFLSFQQTLGAGDAALPSQLYLDVRGAGAEKATTLRLTSGGNLETLRFRWLDAGSSGAPPEIIGPLEALKSIGARLQIDDTETRVQIDLPLPLLETFLNLRRTDRDFLEPSEQRAAQRAVQEYLRGRLPMQINGGSVEPHEVSLAFLDMEPLGAANPARTRRRSAWTTRVRVVQSYSTTSKPQAIELRWTLFNPIVLEVQAVIACGNRESVHRLSTYDPILRWKSAESVVAVKGNVDRPDPPASKKQDEHRTARSSR